MNLDEFRNLDLSEIGSWPTPAKVVVWVMMVGVILFVGYQLLLAPSLARLELEQKQERNLKQDLEIKYLLASNLEAHREQMQRMQQMFGDLLGQLTSETEVAGLLEDISLTGVKHGLAFDYFKPEPEVQREFYVELPIRMRVKGSYHQFGRFISELASLSRIVTLHDIRISQIKGERQLMMELVAKTYRYKRAPKEEQTDRDKAVNS
ncbi:MAG: type 4a pilus biogenesis protein PilO [Gammaproteobacteria bacterium]|nr:type 4a pilus biogenesis protein PilO [Gammaproteobacteria bacterium]